MVQQIMHKSCHIENDFVLSQEYQQNNKNLVIDDCNMKQTVYIYKCQGSTIQIKGKVNSITVGKSI